MTYFSSKIEGPAAPLQNSASNDGSTEVAKNHDAASPAALHRSAPNKIDFAQVNSLALENIDDIFSHWLPDGNYQGNEYVAYNPTRSDGQLGSFKVNTESGKWSDFATGDCGGDVISLIKYVTACKNMVVAAKMILDFIAAEKTNDVLPTTNRRPEHKIKAKATPEFMAIMPIPEEANRTRPIFFGAVLGTPSTTWTYRDASGQVMCYVLRFDLETGKQFRQQIYGKDSSGWCHWKVGAPPTPRPAYGLDRLAARPDAPVVFTEGEKAADAAQRLFPDFVAVTTMNGALSPEKTDFSPFAGRRIYIAPDNDEAGTAYKNMLIRLLRDAGANVVGVLRLAPLARDDRPLQKGYDLVDAETEGWTTEALKQIGEALWEPLSADDRIPSVHTAATSEFIGRPPKKKLALEYANEFAQRNHGGNIASFNNQIIAYAEGYWPVLNPEVDVKKPILMALGDGGLASKVNAIFELVKIQYASRPEDFERNSPLICLNNGTLNPITGELLAHSPNHFLTNKLNIVFDDQAVCPLWMQTLDEIFAPDADKADKIQLLQEFIGYCMIPDTRIHKFLWLVGAGGNGKSLILAVITALIGKVNISYAQMERLQEKFVRAELQGKLVNISSEMSAQATVSDGYLKQITAGDIIEAERKNERPFSFKPYARLIGATNVLPRLLDHTDAFFRRAMILRFNRQFKVEEQDKQREAKLIAELPGILNWALSGLQNLLQRGDFITPSSSQAEASQYRVNSDPVRQFADDFLIPTEDKNRWIGSGALYEQYKDWSMANGYKTLASNQFADRLVGVGIKKIRDKSGRYWAAQYYDQYSPLTPPVARIASLSGKYSV